MDSEFLKHFNGLEDPRQHVKVIYPLEELLLVALCAVIAGCDDWVEIAEFGEDRLNFFREYLSFTEGLRWPPKIEQLGVV